MLHYTFVSCLGKYEYLPSFPEHYISVKSEPLEVSVKDELLVYFQKELQQYIAGDRSEEPAVVWWKAGAVGAAVTATTLLCLACIGSYYCVVFIQRSNTIILI